MDLLKFGLQVWIPRNAVKGVGEESTRGALEKLQKAGARLFEGEREVLDAMEEERRRKVGRGWREGFEEGQDKAWEQI